MLVTLHTITVQSVQIATKFGGLPTHCDNGCVTVTMICAGHLRAFCLIGVCGDLHSPTFQVAVRVLPLTWTPLKVAVRVLV